MKKLIATPIILILLLVSCVPETPPPPYGVWVSEEPQITLFFTPEYQILEGREFYFGIYTVNNLDTKLAIEILPGGGAFTIYNLTEPRRWGGGVIHSGRMFDSIYRMVDGEIHYLISEDAQEKLGIDKIIFRRTDDYEPIDPEWIANFVPRPE